MKDHKSKCEKDEIAVSSVPEASTEAIEPDTISENESIPREEEIAEEIIPAEENVVTDANTLSEREEAEDAAAAESGEKEERVLTVTPSAMALSLRAEDTVNSIMVDVLVALLPVLVWSVYLFGLRPLMLTGVAVLAAFAMEFLCRALFRRQAPPDLTPAVTGVILALGMPPTAPLWLPALGAAIAILPIRQLFGGTGRNRLNPAASALAILYIFFPTLMTTYCQTGVKLPAFALSVETFPVVETTVLDTILNGTLPSQSLGSMFVGLRPGLIGEMSALLLLAGGLYLSIRKIIRPALPLTFGLTVAILTYFFPTLAAASDVIALRYAGYHLLSGNLLFGILFMATDPVTSPRTGRASLLCGVLGGIVTVVIRYYVNPHIGVICAILVINLLARPLDFLLRPSVFGGRQKKKSQTTLHTPEPLA